jgi:hypothetical protein
MKKLVYVLFIAVSWSCSRDAGTEKYLGKLDNIINVHDKVKEIVTEDILLSNLIRPYIIDEYLIIEDYKSPDEILHLFNKNNFAYVTSAIYMGQGPGEIANVGHIGVDEARRMLYINDYGKYCIFSYPLDSILTNPRGYVPDVKLKTDEKQFPAMYQYIHDTLCIGKIIEPVGYSDFKEAVGKWNMLTGEIELMPYKHPEIKRKRITFAVSPEHGIYVECYLYHDLMTICTLDGELKYNIYGRKWDNKTTNQVAFYQNVIFCGDKIVASSLSGGDNFVTDKTGEVRGTYPTQFLVFDLEGNYLQTLDIGYMIYSFCYDKANNRLILTLNDDPQVAYLDLDEVGV